MSRYAERNQRPRTLVETTRALQRSPAPLHDLPLVKITRRDVAARLMELADTSGAIMANRCRAHLSHCFSWAMQQGLAENNPVIGTARPAPEVKGERVLTTDELRQVWSAAGNDGYGRIVKALILTGQRRDRGGRPIRGRARPDAAMWLLPSSRTKNGFEHEVPLAPACWPSSATPRRTTIRFRARPNGFTGWSQCKRRLDQRIARQRAAARLGRPLSQPRYRAADAITPWNVHDLRRTVVTG